MQRTKREILVELLVLQAQNGDGKAVGELATLYHPRLVAYSAKILGDPDAAKDAVQEAWISIMRGIRKLKDPAAFRSWAYRIVHHKSVDLVRKDVRARRDLEEFSQTSVPNVSASNDKLHPKDPQDDELSLIRAEVRKLPDQDQALLKLYYDDQLGLKEIGYITGATVSATKSKLFQLRRKLKKQIERTNHEQEQY